MPRMKTVYNNGFCILCMVLLVHTNAAAVDCEYNLNQCHAQVVELGQNVNHLEAQLALIEGRQESVTNEFKKELTMLSNDVGAAKTVTTRLVEDNVKIEGKIRVLQGVDSDVRVLRKKVTDMDEGVNGALTEVRDKITSVSNNLDEQADAQRKISIFMSAQMNTNKETLTRMTDSISTLQSKLNQLETKVSTMDRGMTSSGGNAGGMAGGSQVRELSERLDGLQDKYDSEIRMLQQQLQTRGL